MHIRRAKPLEYRTLTEISFASKRYWNYPDTYFEIWRDELTLTEKYIVDNDVFVFEQNNVVIGYYSIVTLQRDIVVSGIKFPKGDWLDHMFVMPKFLRQKIGSEMCKHVKTFCKENYLTQLHVLADPNSRGFYEKMGFEYQKEYPSTISGRTTPLLIIQLKKI